MDFPLNNAVIQGLKDPNRDGLFQMYDALANDFQYPNPEKLVIFPDNHDMSRFYTQVGENFDLLKMGIAYYATIRGIPQIYYGTEILLENTAKPGDHGLIRTDFPGGWKEDPRNGFTGVGLSDDQLRIQSFLKKLLNWRKKKTVIYDGKTMHFGPAKGVYVYFRYNKEETVMVVLNKNSTTTLVNTNRFGEMMKNKKQAANVLTGEQFSLSKQLTVPPKTVLILELQ